MITGVSLHDARHRSAALPADTAGGSAAVAARNASPRPTRRGWIGPVLINLVAAATYASLTGGLTGAHAVAACVVALASVAIALVLPDPTASTGRRDAESAALRALLLQAHDALAPPAGSTAGARPPRP